MHQFIDTLRTPRRQQAPVSGEQGISRRVKQVGSQSDGHWKQHGVAAPKHVDRSVWRKQGQCGHHDLCVFFVALLFHDGHNTADRVDRKRMLAHQLGGDVAQFSEHTALDRPVEHRVFSRFEALCGSCFGFADGVFNLCDGHVGS